MVLIKRLKMKLCYLFYYYFNIKVIYVCYKLFEKIIIYFKNDNV